MKKWICLVLAPLVTTAIAEEVPVISLDQAMTLALESDERIEVQRREVSIADQEVNRAWAIVSPRLEASGRYERPEDEIRRVEQVVVPEDSWRGTITARQPLFDGRVLPARRLGLALGASAFHELVHTIRTSLFEVTAIYYEVLRAQQQVEIAGQTVELATEEVTRARARFDAGEARRTEVLRAEVDEARAFRNLVVARNEYEVAKSDLARRIDLPPDHIYTVEEPDPTTEPVTEDTLTLYRVALEQRDDLTAARKRVEAEREQRTVIRRGGWPTLELEYNHRFVDPESFSNRNNFWDLAAVARFDIWDGGDRRISRLQQELRIEQSALLVRELEKLIRLEVQQALLDLETARENLSTLHKEVDLAEENYRTLSEQASVGLATSLDVSTALIALDQARTELASQTFAFEVAKQRVEQATGRFASSLIEVEEY